MKRARFIRIRRYFASIGLVLLVAAPPAEAQPDEAVDAGGLIAVGSPETGSSLDQVQTLLGTPDFVSGDILMYSVLVETGQEPLPADLTLWFRSGTLFFSSYSFALEPDSETTALHYLWISRQLIDIHGEPSSRAAEAGIYETEVWNLEQLDIEHTLILQERRAEHIVVYTANR